MPFLLPPSTLYYDRHGDRRGGDHLRHANSPGPRPSWRLGLWAPCSHSLPISCCHRYAFPAANARSHGLLGGGCWAKIDFIAPPLCLRLGVPLPYDTGKPSLSAAAIADPPVYNRARAARVIPRHEGVPLFGRWMAAAGAELLADADVIVPVPLYRSRLWSRRFIQSALLAQAAFGSTEAEECRRDVSGHRPAGANSGQAHHRCRRRDHHRGHRRGLRSRC